ncbi:MAG: hypothetical protein UT33_C0005G0072 [Candidatus Peregrinibacteria bacterium GW2011_GWC2_39_14]|nr:MAG: hypothetical protein US92_C0001G0072 [Candidatus Peregrinibacteria bacterium GW2011_GWA2_38_36]KKR07128.1 MAG: hypothetical protein UT33_C0005G0072 [Candidatus Peregrinibacteria bacterium GW2011_GWC2_39_14]
MKTLKSLAVVFLAFAMFVGVAATVASAAYVSPDQQSGWNIFEVVKCYPASNGVKIVRVPNTTPYTLSNGCQLTGPQGYKDGILTCVDSTHYKYEWKTCAAPIIADVDVALTADTPQGLQAPSANETILKFTVSPEKDNVWLTTVAFQISATNFEPKNFGLYDQDGNLIAVPQITLDRKSGNTAVTYYLKRLVFDLAGTTSIYMDEAKTFELRADTTGATLNKSQSMKVYFDYPQYFRLVGWSSKKNAKKTSYPTNIIDIRYN